MKTLRSILAAILLLVFAATEVSAQNITNTLGTGGTFTIKDLSQTFLTLKGGNVGIGTQNPGAPLEVNGRLIVDGINGPNQHDRIKINFYPLNGGHALGSEDFHNTYGPNPSYPNSVGHKFYVNGNNLAAQIGKGGWGVTDSNFTAYFAGRVGIGTTSPSANLHVSGLNGVLFEGTFDSGTIPKEGAGTRMMWYPMKAAFRAGYVNGSQWDDANIGRYSTAMGYQTTASSSSSTAMGLGTTASGQSSTAMGDYTTASGNYTTAMGYNVGAGKTGSFIIGDHSAGNLTTTNNDNEFMAVFAGGYVLYTNRNWSTGTRVYPGGTSWTWPSDSTRKENFKPVDGEYVLESIRQFRLESWNYKGQEPAKFRHYGPMSQEWFAAFGRDGLGVIGDDTTLTSADVDGILYIAVKALVKRTGELKEKDAELEARTAELEAVTLRLAELEAKFVRLEHALSPPKELTQRVSDEKDGPR